MSEQIIFISYARADGTEHALNLEKDLKGLGGKVWIDKKKIQPGTYYDDEIEKALTESTYVLYVLTKESVNSAQAKSEIRYAMDEGKIVIPLNFGNSFKKPYFISLLQFIDFTGNYANGLEELSGFLNLKKEIILQKEDIEMPEVSAIPKFPQATSAKTLPPKKTTVAPAKKVVKSAAVKTRKTIQPVTVKPAANAFKLDKSYLYKYEKDATWWLLLPVVIALHIAAVYYGAQLFNYLLSVINLTHLQYHFSWTLIIISGTMWGIVSSIVAGSSATIKTDLWAGYFIPFRNIFRPELNDDFLRGLFSSFFINIILTSAVAAALGFLVHYYGHWNYTTGFLTAYITVSVVALFYYLIDDTV